MAKFTLKGPRRTCLITGASSGIGERYAWHLGAELGHNLILVARRAERLGTLSNSIDAEHRRRRPDSLPFTRVIPIDLTEELPREQLLDDLTRLPLPVDVLVNNAGFGTLGHFALSEESRQREMLRLNCEVPVILSRRLLPKMCEQRGGLIINVASTAAFQPLTYMTTYGATKAFLCSHSLALSAEVSQHGVQVLAHCPGPTSTEFHIAAGLPTKIDLLNAMSADLVVRQALRAVEAGRCLVVNGSRNALLAYLSRVLPASLVAKVVGRMLRPYAELAAQQIRR